MHYHRVFQLDGSDTFAKRHWLLCHISQNCKVNLTVDHSWHWTSIFIVLDKYWPIRHSRLIVKLKERFGESKISQILFTYESRDSLESFTLFVTVKTVTKLKKFCKLAVVVHVVQTTQNLVISRCCFAEDAKKCITIYNSRAKPLFCSWELLFSKVPVAFAIVFS